MWYRTDVLLIGSVSHYTDTDETLISFQFSSRVINEF